MKTVFKIGLAVAIVAALVIGFIATAPKAEADAITAVSTANPAITGFCVSSGSNNSALAWAVITARSGNNGTPVVTFLDYGTDLAKAVLQTYKVNAQATCTFTNSTVTIPVNNTNGFNAAGSAVIVIRHMLSDTYDRCVLTTSTGSTNLVVTQAPVTTTVPGDKIYQCVTTGAGSLVVSTVATTNNLAAPGGIFVGQQGLPLLIEMNGTSAASLFAASGYFLPPVTAGRVLAPPQ